ncbi:putative nitrogen fixation protein NifT [Brenneria tiliae]|uniref:Nitrogen fixation protein NifT n=1 Tax=Brenneria tiliae TaxID=2914984 RepID=A0ABT0MQE5_9GAMM|nr:putative nitrogen fixation protein NifT [Brenneria tiliae]MCL2892074.1 putative nitrogen fixation protein NifT [Brenneria tiliae]MCL2900371.1 putative nitrogen fixation protein NifT [Brenneria tiliae]MCL2904142.1 putative nitrogen fixation protein NifT [Brenneria tiliae]
MANIILRQRADGIHCYIAKKDLEARVTFLEFDQPDRWGGRLRLEGGEDWFITPLTAKPTFPVTLRAKKYAS